MGLEDQRLAWPNQEMVKAILKLTQQQATPAHLARVKTQASGTFALLRREGARPDWWGQLQDGTWTRK